jgi:hypothetical protein
VTLSTSRLVFRVGSTGSTPKNRAVAASATTMHVPVMRDEG